MYTYSISIKKIQSKSKKNGFSHSWSIGVNKGDKVIQWRKDCLPNKQCWNDWMPIWKNMNRHL